MARHHGSRVGVASFVAIVLAGAGVVLSGCTGTTTPAHSSTASSTSSASPSSSPTASGAPELVPDGTAQQNLPIFTLVTETVWAGAHRAQGRAYIDALVGAGFDKKAMQVTQDDSTVGNPAESIQFSVLWKDDQCLVGQVGPATGSPVTEVLPVLGDGTCLLGKTRPIDW